MHTNIKFSIICPFFNTEKFLGQAIESVIFQDYDNWELILINDGSTDESLKIASKFANNDKRIKLITIENSGTYFARNEGIKNATGDYITFLDSDDFVESNMLKILAHELCNSLSDIIIFNIAVFSENNISIKEIVPIKERFEIFGQPEIVKKMFIDSNYGYGLCGGVFNKKLFNDCIDLAPKNIRYAEDMHFAYKLFKASESVIALSGFLYHYRMTQSSVTHNLTPKDYYDRFKIFAEIYSDIDLNYPSLLSDKINSHIFWGIFNYVTVAPKYEKYVIYKKNCKIIRNHVFYKKYIKKYRYSSKRIQLIKCFFNLKLYRIIYRLYK